MKLVLLAPLALLPLAALALARPAQQLPQPIASAPCPNLVPRELLVAYEVTGGTLSGPVDRALQVYSDGSARLSSSLGDGVGSSQLVHAGAAEAEALVQGLIAAGALGACDREDLISDVPLSTLTVLRGVARQRGNSFSWSLSSPQTAALEALLEAFVSEHFAPPPGGGGDF